MQAAYNIPVKRKLADSITVEGSLLNTERQVSGAAATAGGGRLLLPPVLETDLCSLPYGHREGHLKVSP
jgi:hypothetical protein